MKKPASVPTPFYQREIYEKEIKKCLETGHKVPCGEISNENIFKISTRDRHLKLITKKEVTKKFLLIVCVLTGFMQAYKTSNESTSEAHGQCHIPSNLILDRRFDGLGKKNWKRWGSRSSILVHIMPKTWV